MGSSGCWAMPIRRSMRASAIRRADDIDRSPLRRPMPAITHLFFMRCGRIRPCAALRGALLSLEEHGFRQWRGLAHAVRGICSDLLSPSSVALEEVHMALDGIAAPDIIRHHRAVRAAVPSSLGQQRKEAALDPIE